MDSETRTFYYIVIVWVLLVLLGALMQRCCAYRDIQTVYTNYLYGDTGPPNDLFSQGNGAGNTESYVRSSEIFRTRSEQGEPSVKTNEFDKPPSYNEDLPTYIQAIEMERKMNIGKNNKAPNLKEIKFKV
ncbi:uncharacterized protein LOC123308385 [Coccinella septempunctata]|uniref:uncharacterized protein LOC123308385 n=1 Tax=Coccinella septempunctata TaxID=41139 RepID=UPI001D05DFDB|nr:uncharacterized protein LOC123308385 [Coccinella septempunctata]